MAELLDIRVIARKVKVEDVMMGFGIKVDINGVSLGDIIKAVNTALNAKGTAERIGVKGE